MSSSRNQRNSSSAVSQSNTNRSAPLIARPRAATAAVEGNILPEEVSTEIHCLPENWVRQQAWPFANKVVLGFEEEFSAHQVKEWLWDYNQKGDHFLSFFHELPNELFVVQFVTDDLEATKRALLAASPLGAGEVYAAVNDYTADFSPCNQVDFRHLVTVNIAQGNWELLGLAKFIATAIGTYVKAYLGDDQKHIALMVETTRKIFPPPWQVQVS